MNTTIKTISIELLAEKLGGKLWVKGDLKRIYLDEGYNTKKMSTKTYVYLRDGQWNTHCTIECPSQDPAWIDSQESKIINSVGERVAEIIEEFGTEVENPMIAIQAALDAEEQVQGYCMRWHEVKVKINRYGKLAVRKRQQVHTYKGAISKTPAGFVALNDEDFAIALQSETAETTYEYGCEPDLVGIAQRNKEIQAQREEQAKIDAENRRISELRAEEKKKQDATDLKAKIKELKSQGISDVHLAWKALGCPHPAPAEVVEAKNASGLNWKNFQNSIQ